MYALYEKEAMFNQFPFILHSFGDYKSFEAFRNPSSLVSSRFLFSVGDTLVERIRLGLVHQSEETSLRVHTLPLSRRTS